MILAGWSNYPQADCRVLTAPGHGAIADIISREPSIIARGNGRSYGDAALNPEATLMMRGARRILDFDPDRGSVVCESGVLLSELIDVILPRGWFPPVTPGTRLVTIGGMIAADVHGKNHHHAGSFCRHVESLELVLGDGRVVTCSAHDDPETFHATCGGMGLTGVIATARIRLAPVETGWVRQKTVRSRSLDEALEAIEANDDWTYSAAWIDCLARGPAMGRSVLLLGEHATLAELDDRRRDRRWGPVRRRGRRIPAAFPDAALSRVTVRAFNELYYRMGSPGTTLVDWNRFFFPLDALLQWNRLYGRAGFSQYQCVLPAAASAAGLRRLLSEVSAAGLGSFLAVLKRFGPQDAGLLSFPMEGYTLALDFPIRNGTFPLLERLDAIVADHGGRLYLAKDNRMSGAMLQRGYPGLDRFEAARARIPGSERFSSLLWRRLAS